MADIIRLLHNLEEKVVYVDAPYNPRFNQDLMAHRFCPGDRSPWDDDRKMWVTKASCIDAVEGLLEFYFPSTATVFMEEV